MTVKVGINGFGRIGRNFFRATKKRSDAFEVVAINDVTKPETLAHLFKHDSILGSYEGKVAVSGDHLSVDGDTIAVISERDPQRIPWRDYSVDIVIEATGLFTDAKLAQGHREAGASKVIISAPAKGEDLTVCMGVNNTSYDPATHHIISNASCTTNCLAPVVKVLHETVGVEMGLMTTVHAFTNDQVILDAPHVDLRRARSAFQSIIPTTTGAAKALSLVLPELEGKFHGMALRVPVADVSLVDLVVMTKKKTSIQEVNEFFRIASSSQLVGILSTSDKPLVSVDFLQNSNSAIVDLLSTMVIGDKMVKVLAWYDNEWGYSCRLVDLTQYIVQRM